MNHLFKVCLAAYWLAQHVFGSPLAIVERDTSDNPTVYTYITRTVTVSPPDVTRTTYAYTVPVYTSTVNLTVTAGCTHFLYPQYSQVQRRIASPTSTITSDTTVTVTSTGVPTKTVCDYEAVVYETEKEPYTWTHTECTNTLVASYITTATTRSTYTKYNVYTQTTDTVVCMTTLYPPGWFSGNSGTPKPEYTPQPDLFASTTLATTFVTVDTTIWTTVTGDTSTNHFTECNNPTEYYTQIWYTQTVTPYATKTVLANTCDQTPTQSNQCGELVARSIPGGVPAAEATNYLVRRSGADSAEYTTTGLTTPVTVVQTFTDVSMQAVTVTASTTETWTVSVCSLPTGSSM